MKNKRPLVFHNNFDVALYMILVIVCPFFSVYVQHNLVNLNNINTVYLLLFTGVILFLTLFYDFYSKSLSYGSGGGLVAFWLICGRAIYVFVTVALFLICFAIAAEIIDPSYVVKDFYCLYILILIPVFLAVTDLFNRRKKEKEKPGVISLAGDV